MPFSWPFPAASFGRTRPERTWIPAVKRHNQVLIALARRRSDVLFAMLRDGTLYQEPEPRNLPSAA